MDSAKGTFSSDAFAARLREIRKATGRTGAEIAMHGSITKQTFSGYLHTGRLPSAGVLANWVFRLGINANWLLTGEGPMLLDEARLGEDPVVQRVALLVRSLRDSGAMDAEVLRGVQDMLEDDLARLERDASDSDLAVLSAQD
ncbi:MAG: helix-turn-helix transcriptional regulator [Desulfovibrio sp.]|nr:helix-turn-helix transcriptional regulator [Desulfovibrio sp.]